MASQSHQKLTVSTTSPKSDSGSGSGNGNGNGGGVAKGHCLCSPTTHEGSFRCRLHRSSSSNSSTSPTWMKRSKSMPANKPAPVSVSPQ
ncbi:hypothetical protein HN51_070958 [Arachis hypogaea]|uniref:Serine-rich protein n=1 Tax=Arachis hypogaea TaxID=3818 RepID=A0A444YZZ2_ARAHY|nr:uncharacterized protein LOC107642123 [Arachis ipaensis]RYR07512.1 hypothetical protein Ahy_B05g074878 isoform A [Arachis hypogaea]